MFTARREREARKCVNKQRTVDTYTGYEVFECQCSLRFKNAQTTTVGRGLITRSGCKIASSETPKYGAQGGSKHKII